MRGSHQPLNDMLAHDPLPVVFGESRMGGDISSAVHGRQTDLIGAVHLFPSPGATAAPHPVGWEGQQLRLPEMKPTTGEWIHVTATAERLLFIGSESFESFMYWTHGFGYGFLTCYGIIICTTQNLLKTLIRKKQPNIRSYRVFR